MKYVTPAIDSTSFNCPHCGVLAQQFWWRFRAMRMDADEHPGIWTAAEVESTLAEMKAKFPDREDEHDRFEKRIRALSEGDILFQDKDEHSYSRPVDNVWLSGCYACNKLAVWIYDRLVFPAAHDAPMANEDMPADVRRDYEEAAQIVGRSPRGAAAMLRLAIQRLLVHLGGGGENINSDIAKLVQGGLDKRIQMSLDVVRVIGNNAVHPGTLDLNDDRKTADSLFALVNLIVDSMISQPKHIAAAFDALPNGAREAIKKRDGR